MPSVCFTGRGVTSLGHWTRDQWENHARSRGYDVHDQVYHQTTYLVQAYPNSTSSKSRTALAWGVQIVSYDTWYRMLTSVNPLTGMGPSAYASPARPAPTPAAPLQRDIIRIDHLAGEFVIQHGSLVVDRARTLDVTVSIANRYAAECRGRGRTVDIEWTLRAERVRGQRAVPPAAAFNDPPFPDDEPAKPVGLLETAKRAIRWDD
jgi:hypothetical protein